MGKTRFTSDFFAGNRKALRELFTGTAPIVLTANGLLQMNADQAFPFCQEASFWYFTGIDDPDIVLVMDKDKDYLILPERDEQRLTFEWVIDEADLRRRSGVDLILDEQAGWKRLGARLAKAKHVATLPTQPVYIERAGIYTNPARRQLVAKMKGYNEQIELLDISRHVLRLRSIKHPIEVQMIEAAIAITGKALKATTSGLSRGTYKYEYEIEADLTRSFRRQGASGHGFAPVIAAGAKACTLNYNRNDQVIRSGELVLCDVGARYNNYTADITRTFGSGDMSRRQRAVYTAVLEVQRFAVEQLRPGVFPKDYEKAINGFMGERLRELGLLKTIDPEAVGTFCPHASSHFLGITKHDVGSYDEPLEAGMVLAVEPGIYIADESLGVRIEDNVLITPDGNRILSAKIPKDLAN